MNLKSIYGELFHELVNQTGITKLELENYLSLAVAKAYKGVNSALIWEDGTVTIALLNEDKTIYLKDYVVSKKMFQLILNEFNKCLTEKIKNDDMQNYENKIILPAGVVLTNRYYKALPESNQGFLFDYEMRINKNNLFKNDLLNIKRDEYSKFLFVEIVKINKEKKTVECRRFSKKVALKVFNELFEYYNEVVGKNYSINKLFVNLDFKSKKVSYFVEFRNKPKGIFVSELSKTLKKVLGSVEVNFNFKR